VPILADTSGLLALADADDPAHRSVRDYLARGSEAVLVPVTLLAEIDHMVATRLGVRTELALLRSLVESTFRLEGFSTGDLERSLELIEQYADSNIGLVDASIVAIAERLRITRILTLDARHFRMFRPRHCESFELVP